MGNTNQSKEKSEIEESSLQKEDPCKKLVVDINKMIESLRPSMWSECCIYRVPQNLRKRNEAAYTPQVVSIGPFHHDEENLMDMKYHKLRCLEKFRCREGIKSDIILHDFARLIKGDEEKIRKCYSESFVHFKSDKFVKMILVDAAFIIELFLWTRFKDYDFHFMKPWLLNNLKLDLMLLENQIPYFVLKKLYDLAASNQPSNKFPPLLELTRYFFSAYPMKVVNSGSNEASSIEEAKHFTDLLRSLQLSESLSKNRDRNKANSNDIKVYSAAELHEAGVKFKVSSSKCLLDIGFNNGELIIPCLEFYDYTESFIRNLMALEQCHYPLNTYICHHIWLMDSLIGTAKDVELLAQEKIIINCLGDHESTANLVNTLCLNITLVENKSYSRLCRELNQYYETPFHKWKANLRLQYFSNPWIGASTIAAIILLVLTLIQTICSIISLSTP